MESITFKGLNSREVASQGDREMKLRKVRYTKSPFCCQSCGHEIHNLYEVEITPESSLTVGSECVKKMLGLTGAQAITRHERRAAKEWRELAEKPANEERGDYIARRISEQWQARKAWQEWRVLDKTHHWNSNPWRPEKREQAILALEEKYGIERKHWQNKTAYSI